MAPSNKLPKEQGDQTRRRTNTALATPGEAADVYRTDHGYVYTLGLRHAYKKATSLWRRRAANLVAKKYGWRLTSLWLWVAREKGLTLLLMPCYHS